MGEKMNREYFESGAAAFNYNNVTGGGGDSGGSGGSGMECIQLRSPPGPFHYLISEQAKSLVALQELQNEVGALLEFRDLVIETFPNLRSKMSPSTGSATRRSGSDWEPGVRVRRKLTAGDPARAKPQPSVQDSGFSTETSCGKDAHSSSASASAAPSRSRPLEDELWALLDVIQRKGARLRDEAELLRSELDERHSHDTAEESFARALSGSCGDCTDLRRLRNERDALLARAAQLEAEAAAAVPSPAIPLTPLGRLDRPLETPSRPPLVATPDSKKFAAILLESNPVELQRQLLTSTVQNQLLAEKLRRAAAQRTVLLQRLEHSRDQNDDLRFRLEEKNIELEGARARVRQLEGSKQRAASCGAAGGGGGGGEGGAHSLERSRSHSSMRDMEPLRMPDDTEVDDAEEARISETPRRRPSRIPLHTAHKGAAPRPPAPAPPPRPPSAASARSASMRRAPGSLGRKEPKSGVPVRRGPAHDPKTGDSVSRTDLVAEYVARAERLAPLFPRLHTVRTRPLPAALIQHCRLAYETPQNLALELCKSILYENADSLDIKNLKSLSSVGGNEGGGEDSLWNGKPQQYFESMNYGGGAARPESEFDDSLAP